MTSERTFNRIGRCLLVPIYYESFEPRQPCEAIDFVTLIQARGVT